MSSDFAGHFLSLKENANRYYGTEEGKNLQSSEDRTASHRHPMQDLDNQTILWCREMEEKKKLETVIQRRIVRLKVSLLFFFRFLLDFLSSYVCWFETRYSNLCVYGSAPKRWNYGWIWTFDRTLSPSLFVLLGFFSCKPFVYFA